MYIDEVGNADLQPSSILNNRYLSLTGVIFEIGYVNDVVSPAVEELKHRYFNSHVDDPVVFHRKEMVNKKWPFQALRDPLVNAAFDQELLDLLDRLTYTIFTVVIDKQAHVSQYAVWRFDPYHYCQTVLVERFARWLQNKKAVGDVLAESRGGKADLRLKDSFESIYDKGTDYLPANRIQQCLTSRQLKVKSKSNNIAGLQIADMIAYPSYAGMLAQRLKQPQPVNFGGRVFAILERDKYDRRWDGRIDGWGRKWLP